MTNKIKSINYFLINIIKLNRNAAALMFHVVSAGFSCCNSDGAWWERVV